MTPCILYITHDTLYIVYYLLTPCILYITHDTLYIVYFPIHPVYCIFPLCEYTRFIKKQESCLEFEKNKNLENFVKNIDNPCIFTHPAYYKCIYKDSRTDLTSIKRCV